MSIIQYICTSLAVRQLYRAQPLRRRNGRHRSSRFGVPYCIFTLPEAARHALVMRGSMARKRVVVADPRGVGMGGKGVAGCGANRQVSRDNAARDASHRHEQNTLTRISRLYLLVSHAVAGDAEGLWDAENICIRASPGRMRTSMRPPIRSAMLGGSESQRFADATWVLICQSGSRSILKSIL